MNDFIQGVRYNLRGLKVGLKTPKLLMLGLLRFAIIILLTIAAAALVVVNYQDILSLMWSRPESVWVVWLWHLVSWLLALLLTGIAAVVAFVLAQVLFSVVIMDIMSQITERQATGTLKAHTDMPFFKHFFFLLRQEIPRAVAPILISLLLLGFGWLTPLGPVFTILSSLAVGLFLAWDNTDLVPARRLTPFNDRLGFFRSHLGFHLGFGILFLIPLLNILLISFAPVGATLYFVEKIDTLGGAVRPQ